MKALEHIIGELAQVLAPLEPDRRDATIKELLVGTRGELYSRDLLEGRVDDWYERADMVRPGAGAHSRGPGGRTARPARHEARA